MRKKSGLLFSLLAVCGILNAQDIEFGVKGGVNISSLGDYEKNISYEDIEFEHKLGLYAGIFTQICFDNNFGIETGLFYSMLGGEDKENDYNEQYKVTANPAYLQLPISVFYKFDLPFDIDIYPSIGLYGGYGLHGKLKQKGMIANEDISSEMDYFDVFANKFDLGGTIGLTAEYEDFLLGVAYDRSIIRVNKTDVVYGDNAFNSNLRVTLGYKF